MWRTRKVETDWKYSLTLPLSDSLLLFPFSHSYQKLWERRNGGIFCGWSVSATRSSCKLRKLSRLIICYIYSPSNSTYSTENAPESDFLKYFPFAKVFGLMRRLRNFSTASPFPPSSSIIYDFKIEPSLIWSIVFCCYVYYDCSFGSSFLPVLYKQKQKFLV